MAVNRRIYNHGSIYGNPKFRGNILNDETGRYRYQSWIYFAARGGRVLSKSIVEEQSFG